VDTPKIKFAGFIKKDDSETITIKQIEKKLKKKYKKEISLESFILSPTSHQKLIEGNTKFPSKDEYIKHHMLFLDDKDWPGRLWEFLIRKDPL
jgi:2-oxoglutarate dehydrogenase complex dehydrogenase (E1) component-like enzyme